MNDDLILDTSMIIDRWSFLYDILEFSLILLKFRFSFTIIQVHRVTSQNVNLKYNQHLDSRFFIIIHH